MIDYGLDRGAIKQIKDINLTHLILYYSFTFPTDLYVNIHKHVVTTFDQNQNPIIYIRHS